MSQTKEVTFDNAAATLTINSDDTWTISGNAVNQTGKGVMELMALMDDKRLSMVKYERNPNAAAAAAGSRRSRRRRHQRKTRRYRK